MLSVSSASPNNKFVILSSDFIVHLLSFLTKLTSPVLVSDLLLLIFSSRLFSTCA